ncbi:hypothetical protein JCM8097_004076 [Rhodosporidiobolus ruineniae]
MVNNKGWIDALSHRGADGPPRKRPHATQPCIARHLPSLADLAQTATEQAHLSRRAHIIDDALNTLLTLPEDAASPPSPDKAISFFDKAAASVNPGGRRGTGPGLSREGNYEPFEVLRAIDKKDVMLVADVKARQFDLLVSGNPLPLVYALRLGKSHADMAVILVGAMSRKVNDVTDDELAMKQPATIATLRALRANLKIALSASLSPTSGLPQGDTSLLSSFLQVLLMLEGSRFLASSSQTVSLALRQPPKIGKPVEAAEGLLHKWVSRELKERQVASVKEYLANATGDLVMLGIWGVVMDQLPMGTVEAVPLYFFARDDRIHKALQDRLHLLRQSSPKLYSRLSSTVRSQLATALDVLGRRATLNGSQRVELLRAALDRGEKVGGSKV